MIIWNMTTCRLVVLYVFAHVTTCSKTVCVPSSRTRSMSWHPPQANNPYMDEMRATAQYISRPGFGILVRRKHCTTHQRLSRGSECLHTQALHAHRCHVAFFANAEAYLMVCYPLLRLGHSAESCLLPMQASDESNATTGKRLDSVGVENTETNRRDWRQTLYTTPGESPKQTPLSIKCLCHESLTLLPAG